MSGRHMRCAIVAGLVATACDPGRSATPANEAADPIEPASEAPPVAAPPKPTLCSEKRTAVCATKRAREGGHPGFVAVDDDALYWRQDDALFRMPRAQGEPEQLLRDIWRAAPQFDATWIYTCVRGPNATADIVRLPKAGGPPTTVARMSSSCEFAIHDRQLYFAERDKSFQVRIVRVPLDGGTKAAAEHVSELFSGGGGQILADSTHVYWQASDTIHKFDPATDTRDVVVEASSLLHVGMTRRFVYWLDGSDLRRRAKSGGDVELVANFQDVLSFASTDTALFWASVGDEAWRRFDEERGTLTTYAVPPGASSIAVDGSQVWWSAFTETGAIDTLDTCGCGDDVLVPTDRERAAQGPEHDDKDVLRMGYIDDDGVVVVQAGDLSSDEAVVLETLARSFRGQTIPAGTKGLPQRFAAGDAYRVATTEGVFDATLVGFEAGSGGEGTFLFLRLEATGIQGEGALVAVAPATDLGPLRRVQPRKKHVSRYLPAVRKAFSAAKLGGTRVGPSHVEVVAAKLPAPHAVVITVAVPGHSVNRVDADPTEPSPSAMFLADKRGAITATIYEPASRLDVFGVEYVVDVDGDGRDEVGFTSSYYEGHYEHLLSWAGNVPGTSTLGGDGA